MSIARALSNAVSGLTATARGTETVAANLANAMTPGYAKRELSVSVQSLGGNGGGVRIDGVTRVVNASVLAESRQAGAASAEAQIRLDFQASMEQVVGLPGEGSGLASMLSEFQTALQSAAARPDDEIRLSQAVMAADRLAQGLNSASAAVQKARQTADEAIAADVATLSASLERVAYLNRRISILQASGGDASGLIDERAVVVDQISTIVPLQEVAREGGKIALFTTEGAVLLDGSKPSAFAFDAAGQFTADAAVGSGSVMRLMQDGQELTANQMRLFAGGSLAANFAVRDELAPQLQQEMDALAFDLHERLADPSVDGSITATDPGLFTDDGVRADPTLVTGLASRLQINASVDPDVGGALWRMRSGAGASTSLAVGDSTYLTALSTALDAAKSPIAGSGFDGSASFAARLATIESRVATRRVNSESDASVRNARAETLASRLMADGVDSDTEMQRLLEYEQAYAANARVIQAIDEMMDQILRL